MFSRILLHAFPLYINLIANYCRRNKAIWYLFCTMRQLFFETFGRHFDLFWRRALDSNLEIFISFALCLWLFSEEFSQYISSRGHFFVTSTKKIEGEGAGGTKFWPILLMVVHGFPGEGGFLSVICKDFLHLCDCLVLQYFLEAGSIYSSIIERQRLIIKVGSINVCLLSCQFLNLWNL